MKAVDIPTKFPIPWGAFAGGGFIRAIPTDSQIPTNPGFASLHDGFVPLNMTPVAAGGIPPFGQDHNGILNQVTKWLQWQAAGGPIAYDSAYSSAIGGYPLGTILQAFVPGNSWISTVDDNVTNPDAGGAGWSPYGLGTGVGVPTIQTVANYGWVMANDGTLGNAASNGTTYAGVYGAPLFSLIWNGVTNTNAPLYTSGGILVARGVDAPTDYAANRAITVPKVLGRALAIAGAGAALTVRALGFIFGEETHALNVNENAAHDHPINFASGGVPITSAGSGVQSGGAGAGIDASLRSLPSGSGTPHNNMQPSSFWNFMIKL